jgi:hypothetical protein
MREIILIEHHDQVYAVWKQRKLSNLKVAHVDFHCDMNGLYIDRPSCSAFFNSARKMRFVDRGNYLAHSIMEGIVTDLCWVHDAQGGRAFDVGPVVAYEADILAPWYRLKQKFSKQPVVSFAYQECLLQNWQGPEQNEQLDLDWDALASVEYSDEHRNNLIANFLEREFAVVPQTTFLVYSPGYSHPDRAFYEDFAQKLSNKFGAQIVRLPSTELNTEGESFAALRRMLRRVLPSWLIQLKKKSQGSWRYFESKNDLEFYKS